jgi:hypothetical protein
VCARVVVRNPHDGSQSAQVAAGTVLPRAAQLPSFATDRELDRFTLVMGAHLDSHFMVEPAEKGEQLVGGEKTKMSVHQMGHVGLHNAKNTCDFGFGLSPVHGWQRAGL